MATTGMKIGDLVAGSWTKEGKQLTPAKFVGTPEQINALRDAYTRHMSGIGEPLVVQTKRITDMKKKQTVSSKKKNSLVAPFVKKTDLLPTYLPETNGHSNTVEEFDQPPVVHSTPAPPTTTSKRMRINLTNQHGTSRMRVEEILDCPYAVALIFANEEDITLIPHLGDIITMSTADGNEMKVYYTGFLFDWTDGVKQVMILCKVPDGYEDTINEQSHEQTSAEASGRYSAE